MKKLTKEQLVIINVTRKVLSDEGLSFQKVVDYERELRANTPLKDKLLSDNTLPNDFIENDTLRTERPEFSQIVKTFCHVFHYEGEEDAWEWWGKLTAKQKNEIRSKMPEDVGHLERRIINHK